MKLMDDDTYMFGEDIVTNGFADFLIETDSEKDKAVAQENGLLMFNNTIKAMEEEALSTEGLREAVSACKGNCTLGTIPSTEKIANSNKGESMAKTLKEIQAELDTANTAIEGHKSEVGGKDSEILALQTESGEKDTKISALMVEKETLTTEKEALKVSADAQKEAFPSIVASMYEMEVPKEIAADMAKCETLDEAEKVCFKAMKSDGVTFGGTQETNTDGDSGWGKVLDKRKGAK